MYKFKLFILDEYISSRIDAIEEELKENTVILKNITTSDSSINELDNTKLSDIKDEHKVPLYEKMKLKMKKNGSIQEKGRIFTNV